MGDGGNWGRDRYSVLFLKFRPITSVIFQDRAKLKQVTPDSSRSTPRSSGPGQKPDQWSICLTRPGRPNWGRSWDMPAPSAIRPGFTPIYRYEKNSFN